MEKGGFIMMMEDTMKEIGLKEVWMGMESFSILLER